MGTALAPQDTSLMVRLDLKQHSVTLRLETRDDDGRFIWQNWVNVAMGCMKGAEENGNCDCGYGRHIVRADLRQPIVELSPMHLNEDGIEAVVEQTRSVRVCLGWPVFDVRVWKFEIEQWLAACDDNVNRNIGYENSWKAEKAIA